MAQQITCNDKYIRLEYAAEINCWEILEGVSRLFSMPEFSDKHALWVFRDKPLKIFYPDIYKIKDYAERLFPAGPNGKKTAIVTQTGIQNSLASLYVASGINVDREVKVFSNLKSAEYWIEN